MKQQILVIQGGDAFETYEEYLVSLKSKQISLDRIRFKDWKKNLQETLGASYDVILPQMPNSQNARYAEWKIWFDKIIVLLDEPVILVGHSLGGIFLAKYLSENETPKKVKATFLVAAPYNSEGIHPLADFILSENLARFSTQGGKIFLYHSKDDFVVPFSNLALYKNALPDAHMRIFDDRQHFKQAQLTEIVEDIRSLK